MAPRVIREDGREIVSKLRTATTHWEKFRGLMLDTSLQPGEALWIDQCQAIHCCFMKIPIDVVFLSHEGEVLHLIERMAPWTFSKFVRKASQVLECYPGTIEQHGLSIGMKLKIVDREECLFCQKS